MRQANSHTLGNYRSVFWRRIALLSCVASIAVYIAHEAYPVKNGGTAVGLTMGIIGAAIIFLLMTLGIRKRAYHSRLGTVRGWVSAHVYLGLTLVVVGTLHTGFQFGFNIHGASWLLMCVVVATGIWGISAYTRYPQLLNQIGNGQSLDLLLSGLSDFDSELSSNSSNFPEDIIQVIDSSISGTVIGGGVRTQIGGIDRSKIRLPAQRFSRSNSQQSAALGWLTAELSENRDNERGKALKIALEGITYRQSQLETIRESMRINAKLKLWLMFHIPLSFALVAALAAHVFAVLVYP